MGDVPGFRNPPLTHQPIAEALVFPFGPAILLALEAKPPKTADAEIGGEFAVTLSPPQAERLARLLVEALEPFRAK